MNLLLAHLLDAAGRAPSPHNTQPWKLEWKGDELHIRVMEERMLPAADPEAADAIHAMGALLENLVLTLSHLGYEGDYTVAENWRHSGTVIVLRWSTCDRGLDSVLYRMIPIRRTSRLAYMEESISRGIIEEMQAAACPGRLYVLTDRCANDELRCLTAKTSAEALQKRAYAAELYAWTRFSRRAPGWYRDGLNAECLGWNRGESLLARQLLRTSMIRILTKTALTRWLYTRVDQHAPYAPALCLLTSNGATCAGRVEAGRALQRVWLTAAAHGLVTHPLSSAVDNAHSRNRVFQLFSVLPGETHVNLFRVGRSPTTPRSPRLPADELLESHA